MTKQGLASNLGPGIQVWSYQFTYLDLQQSTSGSGAKTLNLFNLLSGPPYNTSIAETWPLASIVLKVRVKHSVAFAGPSISAMTVSLGSSGGSATQFTSAYDVYQAVADGTLQETATPAMGKLSAVTPTVTFTPTGANCSVCTAGVVNIDVFLCPITTTGQVSNQVQVSPNPL